MRYWEDIRTGETLEPGPVEVTEDEAIAFAESGLLARREPAG